MLPTQVTAADKTFSIYAEMEKVEPKIFCRIPKCKSSSFTEKGSRATHERTLHPRKIVSCKNCDFFAENRATIENHNFRFHRAVKENVSDRVKDDQLLETSSRPELYFDVAIVEPFQHGVDTVLVAEHVTIEELLIHQPQPSFLDDNWEPDSIDESLCQPETFNVAPGHS
ncbi:hypothetical protein DAPPUDRAFT_332491 [Daphnia pulex]|uniref:Uncharacterized protein n=1 Tax=Daphnia pulex TaxID=6669 RepID=E9HQ43_DAPPU|nr:hypothetical protein DAPPUDRAFT_332491 [Daphnia pulex]|eukprot:EFX66144.1 hypothetical protein DAPPUDRAFT_332491 [Daphnia pulex]